MGGVKSDKVVKGDYTFAQNCTEGFFCELGSTSPIGNGLCPKGFTCPEGTAVPVPTPRGFFSEIVGTVVPAACLPGYYAPTVESTFCYPCPPGTQCDNDGTREATVCGPGNYRSILDSEGVLCRGCPQGTWSKQYQLRDKTQCLPCPTGVVCPIDGMTTPCSQADFPTPYAPTDLGESESICLAKGTMYYFGRLLPPIDSLRRGPNFVPDSDPDRGSCYVNFQPSGSVVYQKFQEFHGPLYEIQNNGSQHQGYGNPDFSEGHFAKGSFQVPLDMYRDFNPSKNCTPGFFLFHDVLGVDQWYPGTCEADIICNTLQRPEANPCSEGFVCDERTSASLGTRNPCPPGYACDFGSTPDLDLRASQGKYKLPCPLGFECGVGTGAGQATRAACPVGYFCPTGTSSAFNGIVSSDAWNRQLSRDEADPFRQVIMVKVMPDQRVPTHVTLHDQMCFNGINEKLNVEEEPFINAEGARTLVKSSTKYDLRCARDHKWRTVIDAMSRRECFCNEQIQLAHEMWRLWKCTHAPNQMCSFELPDLSLWERFPTLRGSQWVLDRPVVFPHTPQLAAHYFRSCGAPTRDCATTAAPPVSNYDPCLEFCSFAELKNWIEVVFEEASALSGIRKTAGVDDRMDQLIYDLKMTMDMLDDRHELTMANDDKTDDDNMELGDELPNLVRTLSNGLPYRPDLCMCENLVRCPNGTTSIVGSKSIYDCLKKGNDVLVRKVPIPEYHPRIVNASAHKRLNDLYLQEEGMPILPLRAWETAVVTMNLTDLHVNLTYNDHYQFSVYVDCLPCPTRYLCERDKNPMICSWPPLSVQKEFGYLCEDCCACERHSMPRWFETNIETYPAYDNKHTMVSLSVLAIRDVEVLITVELLHGLYYAEFAKGFEAKGELHVTTPHRSKYVAGLPAEEQEPTAFVSIMDAESMLDTMLPLNMPFEFVRRPLTAESLGEFDRVFENRVLLGRNSDIINSHPQYQQDRAVRRNFTAHQLALAAQGGAGRRRRLLGARRSTVLLPGPVTAPHSQREAVATGLPPLMEVDEEVLEAYLAAQAPEDPALPPRGRKLSGIDVSVEESINQPITFADTVQDAIEEARYQFFLHALDNVTKVDVFRDELELTTPEDTFWESADPLGEMEFLAVPYLPYFSNCQYGDSYLTLGKLLEDNPNCPQEPLESTAHIEQWPWEGKMVPQGDGCYNLTAPYDPEDLTSRPGFDMHCAYEEDVYNPAANVRWFEFASGATLFKITKEPVPASLFAATEDGKERWGRTEFLDQVRNTDNALRVQVGEGGEEAVVPKRITLRLRYFQVEPTYKRLVQIVFDYGELCTTTSSQSALDLMSQRTPPIFPCPANDYNYTLEVTMRSLDWLELLNLFEYDPEVYIMFFFIIGMVTAMLGACFWCCHRVKTRLKHVPTFRFRPLWRVVTPAPCRGILLGTIPIFTAVYGVLFWFVEFSNEKPVEVPNSVTLEGTPGDFLDQAVLDVDRITKYKQGRVGTGFIAAGLYMIIRGAHMFAPDDNSIEALRDNIRDEDEEEEERKAREEQERKEALARGEDVDEAEMPGSYFWTPFMWKRFHLLLVSLSTTVFLVFILEFSYSHSFADNQYLFIIIFKVVQMFIDLAMAHLLRENLLIAPIMVLIELTEVIITMGAENFTDFVVAYFVETVAVIMERVYLDPGLKRFMQKIPMWKMACRRRCMRNRRQTREERAQEEMEWKRINEQLQLEKEGVEPLLDSFLVYSNETCALFMAPFAMVLMMVTDANAWHGWQLTQIPFLYGIRERDLGFYTIFAFMIIPASLALDMFLLNTQELVHNWRLYDYVAYQNYRFTVREHRWQMDSPNLDESISEPLQTVDNMYFSSQYYFMATFYAWGMWLCMLGITIHLRIEYSLFNDQMFFLILIIVWRFAIWIQAFYTWLGNLFGIWKMRHLEGTVDDSIAAKLAVGEGLSADLEQERLELQALNSERFRHRFLARNRPWILQHMVELLTPRTLQMPGADGRPNIEYIRDVYMDLMNMGEGKRIDGGREDISDDDGEDDLAEMRRHWSKAPVTGASAVIARMWLKRARMRMTYKKLVVGIMENNKSEECDQCHRHVRSGFHMRVEVANGKGEPDPTQFDRLIEGFEAELAGAAFLPQLWQAYFRRTATYYTRCNICIDAMERAQRQRQRRVPGQVRGTRPGDVSSDEEDAEQMFEPMVVARSSVEGRLMAKWLVAARRRIGGAFPRPQARKEMEAYAAKLRRRKAQGARKAAAKQRRKELQARGVAMVGETEHFGVVHANAATKAIAVKWLGSARDSMLAKEKQKAVELRAGIAEVLQAMPEEMDWFYGADVRVKGERLTQQGLELHDRRKLLEVEEDAKLRQIKFDVAQFERKKKAEISEAREALDKDMTELRAETEVEMVGRIAELTRKKRDLEMDWAKVEDELAPEEKSRGLRAHREEVAAIDASVARVRAKREERLAGVEKEKMAAIKTNELRNKQLVRDKAQAAARKSTSVRLEYMSKIRQGEGDWRRNAQVWIRNGRKKIEAKKREDLEARSANRKKRAPPPIRR